MGAAESTAINEDGVTTVSQSKAESLDPRLKRLQELDVPASLTNAKARSILAGRQVGALLPAPSAESGLKEILLGSSCSNNPVENLTLDATTSAELFILYHEWQKENVTKLSKRQEDIGYRIEAVEELALKLYQRLGHSASVMRTTASHLEEVKKLKNDVNEMKEILENALKDYNALWENINENGPEYLKGLSRPILPSDLVCPRSCTDR